MAYCILTASWVVFFLIHSLLAAEKCKAFLMSRMGARSRYYRLVYSMFASVSLTAVLMLQFYISDQYFHVAHAIKLFVALPCAIAAMVLMAICIRKYFYKLSGVEVLFDPADDPVLETEGVHKIVRHPLYLGTLLLIWSLFLLSPSLTKLIACLAITGYVLVGIWIEERKLVRFWGAKYVKYKGLTPMLIPYKIVYPLL